MANNINKLTKAQLKELLQAKQSYYSTLEDKLQELQTEHNSLKNNYTTLRDHATKQNTEIQQLKTQQTQQAYTLIINNTHQYDFPNKEDCHSWMKEKLHSYKLLNTITTPACKVVFIQAVSKAKAATK